MQLAKEEFRSRIRKLVGEIDSACVDTFKLRTTDWQTGQPLVIEKLNQILEFNALLIALKNRPDTSRFAGDLESVSFLVGDMRKADLELLYRIYATYSLSSGRIEEDKLAALNQLGNIFGLGTKKTESIKFAITSDVYRERVAQSIISGRLEAAKSRTDFLQNLCKELKFNAQEALKIHEELCLQIQKQPLSYRKSSTDVKSLERIRNMLSVTKPISELEHPDNMQL